VNFGQASAIFPPTHLPAGRDSFPSRIATRAPHAFLVLREIESERPFAHRKPLLNPERSRLLARIISYCERSASSCSRSSSACIRWRRMSFPTGASCSDRCRWSSTDRANVNAHAAFFAVQMILAVGNDHRCDPRAPTPNALTSMPSFTHAHAAEAQNAARRVVINGLGPFLLGLMAFFFV